MTTTGRSPGIEPASIALLAGANVALSRLPDSATVPVGLGAGALLTWLARRDGASWGDLGMEPGRASSGASTGVRAAAPVVGVVAVALAFPATRRLVVDRQAVEATRRQALYHVLLRIPFGTALAEEILFRGALLGILERRHAPRRARALNAALFGLWHVAPTLRQIETHPQRGRVSTPARKVATVVAAVAATTLAGHWLASLRDRGRSVAAPAVAHAAVNVAGFLGGWLLARRANR